MSKKKKIFLGLFNIANISINLKIGLEKLGFIADFYSIEKNLDDINYDSIGKQMVIKLSSVNRNIFSKLYYFLKVIKIILKYDYYFFIPASNSYFTKHLCEFKVLKIFRKKVCLVCVGCDARVPEYVSTYKWNPCKFCNEDYQSFVGCRPLEKKEKCKNLESKYDYIFSPKECADGFTNYFNILFPVSLGMDFYPCFEKDKSKFKVLHAPSNELIKGTKFVDYILGNIRKQYSVEYIKVIKTPKIELYKKLIEADLVIDQLLVGFYGVLAVEAMLLEKPVICYIREDIWDEIKDECPIINANPDNLYSVLEDILQNPDKLKEIGKKSKEYAIKYHSPENVAKYILSKLESS